MKMLRGGAPGLSAADMWSAIRDNPKLARPEIPSEVKGYEEIFEPAPPSKAHIKRLRRPREIFVDERKEYRPMNPTIRDQLEFHKSVIAELGGSRTIVASEPVFRPKVYIEPVRELDRREEQPKVSAKLRSHVEARRKMAYHEHQEDWLQNLEAGLL